MLNAGCWDELDLLLCNKFVLFRSYKMICERKIMFWFVILTLSYNFNSGYMASAIFIQLRCFFFITVFVWMNDYCGEIKLHVQNPMCSLNLLIVLLWSIQHKISFCVRTEHEHRVPVWHCCWKMFQNVTYFWLFKMTKYFKVCIRVIAQHIHEMHFGGAKKMEKKNKNRRVEDNFVIAAIAGNDLWATHVFIRTYILLSRSVVVVFFLNFQSNYHYRSFRSREI